MFKIGDKIVYPMHGAGTIVGIEKKKILGDTHEYYILEMPAGNVKVMVPVKNAEEIGVRNVLTEEYVDEVIDVFKNYIGEKYDNNWNKRYRENIERMKKGDLKEIAKIAKALLVRDREKALSNAERKMFVNAKNILFSELSLIKKMSYEELEEMLF